MADQLMVPLDAHERSGPYVVCVTGATGFVAGPIVERLLAAGHTVHGTCRDPSDASKVAHLRALPGASERLKLFAADLLTEGSFDAAVAGCSLVLHTASPVIMVVPPGKTAREILFEPAVTGVRNLLASVQRTPSVTRVVLTSSMAAVYGDNWEHGKDTQVTPRHWNHTATETKLVYKYSKVMAEKAAWDFHQACFAQDGQATVDAETYAARPPDSSHRWRLVCVNPAVVMGPLLGRVQGTALTVQFIVKLIQGKLFPLAPPLNMCTCDVREVAAVHTRAAMHPSASGRYLVSSARSSTFYDWSRILAERGYPMQAVMRAPLVLFRVTGPRMGVGLDMIDAGFGKVTQVDARRMTEELGIHPVPLRTSIFDAAASIVQHGVATPPALLGWTVRGIGTAGGLGLLAAAAAASWRVARAARCTT